MSPPSGTLLEYLEKEKTMVKITIGGGNKQDATIQDNNGLLKEKTMVRRIKGGTIDKT